MGKITKQGSVLFFVVLTILVACQPAATPTSEKVVETQVVTEVVIATPVEVVQVVTPTPEPEGPRTLVICMGTEPDSNFIYGSDILASSHVHEMIYDHSTTNGFNNRSFDYQPVIWEKKPSLADSDALLNAVTANEGDVVVDADGNVTLLDPASDPPVMLIPAGGTMENIFEYIGGNVELDQMVVTFVLKPNIIWSDGTPVTAADSVYTFKLASDPDSSASKYVPARTASYEAIDDLTLVWTGLPGYKDATYFINAWQPLPEHQLGEYTAQELLEADEARRTPMGFGPYTIQEWIEGDSITFTKNPTYFRADEGLPQFDTVIFRYIGQDTTPNIAALLSGECDVLDSNSGLQTEIELVIEMHEAERLNATFTTGTFWGLMPIGIQHLDYDDGYQIDQDRPDFFSDVRMRRALAMCTDRQGIVDNFFFSQSPVIDSYIPPQHPLYNPDITRYEFDVEAGSALLEEVGWVDDDADPSTPRVAKGVERVQDGTKLKFSFEGVDAPNSQRVMSFIEQTLSLCGIQLDVKYFPSSEWWADGPEGRLFGRRFDLSTLGWLTGTQPPCDLYLSSQTPGPSGESMISIMTGEEVVFQSAWGGQNNSGFVNEEYDQACNTALNALPGQSEYEAAHLEAQRIFAEQLPAIPIYLVTKLAATRPDMCNFIMDPTENSEFWNIEEFDYGEGCEK